MSSAGAPGFAEIAVGLPVPTTFHYRVPKRLSRLTVGERVWVPFRNRQMLGVVVGLVDRPEIARVKAITQIVDERPVVDAQMLQLTRWMADNYHASWGQTIQTALPGPLRRGKTTMETRSPETPAVHPPTAPHVLTAEQARAVEAISGAAARGKHAVFLLYGVTGSGKTEVYLQAIDRLLPAGKSAIVLVPEISLTPQAIERFEGRFGASRVAVLHSGMLESRRLQEWHRIRSGEARVVVGARSAVFAPVRSLGLIVIDEEHEPSYKQDEDPRYHAREVAIHRGRLAGAPVVLGSATPSIESFYEASQGRYETLRLSERIEQVPLPQVDVVDMREEFSSGRRGGVFSRQLEEALADTLGKKEQAILFLNRRGFSTFIQCRKCGQVIRCGSCQVSMTYHIAEKQLVCHYCRRTQPAPEICPHCRSEYVKFQGAGTQRVESELARLFPGASIARMDTDSMKARGSHAKTLADFREHKIDVLIGTQMVAKGLDFPRVTLVGVISADTALNLPDFRSAERTFNLLTQVAGRAGRGKLPGRVVVQTFTPHYYAIQAASRHDYEGFYKQEIQAREQTGLPPYARLARLTVRSLSESRSAEYARLLAEKCRAALAGQAEVIGPAQPPVSRLRRQYLWQVLIKAKSAEPLLRPLEKVLRANRPARGCYLATDIDPL